LFDLTEGKAYICHFVFDNYRIELEKYEIWMVYHMSEDIKEEMRKLKEEMAGLKEQLKDIAEPRNKRDRGFYIDVGGPVQDYVQDVMQGVAQGVHGELEKSVFIGPRGIRIFRNTEPFRDETKENADFGKVAGLMSALGSEHRLKILNELMSGGRYVNELQEKLSEITTSTLSSHLNVLEETGLVVQEKVRGRYLITMPGRTVYKMAMKVTRFLGAGNEE